MKSLFTQAMGNLNTLPHVVKLRVMDYDMFSNDDPMGIVMLDLDQQFADCNQTTFVVHRWFTVCPTRECLKACGEIELELKFIVQPLEPEHPPQQVPPKHHHQAPAKRRDAKPRVM